MCIDVSNFITYSAFYRPLCTHLHAFRDRGRETVVIYLPPINAECHFIECTRNAAVSKLVCVLLFQYHTANIFISKYYIKRKFVYVHIFSASLSFCSFVQFIHHDVLYRQMRIKGSRISLQIDYCKQ